MGKQCLQFENLCCKLENDLNATQIDVTQREMELKQTISDELCTNANERDKALKEYLHNHLKKIIEETIARYQKNDLYQNQVYELSNEILSGKYVQNELTQQLERALFDNEELQNKNDRMSQMIKTANLAFEKWKGASEKATLSESSSVSVSLPVS